VEVAPRHVLHYHRDGLVADSEELHDVVVLQVAAGPLIIVMNEPRKRR
jgi:hypothetical protein